MLRNSMPHDCHAQSWKLVFMLSVHAKCVMSVTFKAATQAKPLSLQPGALPTTCSRAIQPECSQYLKMQCQDLQRPNLGSILTVRRCAKTDLHFSN